LGKRFKLPCALLTFRQLQLQLMPHKKLSPQLECVGIGVDLVNIADWESLPNIAKFDTLKLD